jgi:hypothetical protein
MLNVCALVRIMHLCAVFLLCTPSSSIARRWQQGTHEEPPGTLYHFCCLSSTLLLFARVIATHLLSLTLSKARDVPISAATRVVESDSSSDEDDHRRKVPMEEACLLILPCIWLTVGFVPAKRLLKPQPQRRVVSGPAPAAPPGASC